MVRKGSGTSHAKIILIGEHSVVYGQPAIALPLSRVTCTATMTETLTPVRTIDSRYFDGLITELPEQMAGVRKLLDRLIRYFNGEKDYWHLSITSMLPAERGMGSSAATAVAIIKSFFDYYDTSLDQDLLLKLADVEEQVTHRSPSGLDAATVSSIQPIWYVKGKQNESLSMNIDGTLLIVDTGVHGQTKEAIAAVKQELENNSTKATKRISHLGQLTTETRQHLIKNEVALLGKCLTLAQHDLSALSVSHPSIDSLIDVAMNEGALGAKLTGGGRGGCFLVLLPNESAAKLLAVKMVEAGASATWIQPLSGGFED
ncbi:mevalonate kinase [Paucilactobacillus suebicus]|uniref:Mevalonate kinase n=1 Tax=Paucilactobacillus suebicus DSM 5007 = KCTC 3549 TaxID=1423807 RepID=A0A0R1VUI0_9LACO|nr:mevalonate kinase [Paucilactobacillus suebicus]KRM09422.1 mevalonate kinase [Paucilactobacillus suebicus DSM 5007 = KCTC 3549]